MSEIESLKKENKELKKELEIQKALAKGFEDILILNEKEMQNYESLIAMYENIVEFSRKEHLDERETMKAQQIVSDLSSEELNNAFKKIEELEKTIKRLKDKKQKLSE